MRSHVFQFLLQSLRWGPPDAGGRSESGFGTFLEKSTGQGDGNPPSAQEGQNNQQDSGRMEVTGRDSPSSRTELRPWNGHGEQWEYFPERTVRRHRPEFAPGSGSQKPDVSLEGPSAVVSARETQVLALPNVEYGPGMDASVITGDSTGASETSPVPSGQSYVDIIMNAGASPV